MPVRNRRAGVSHAPGQLFEQRRLAAARTAGHQHDAARPAVTCAKQLRQFLAAADERRTHPGSIACASGGRYVSPGSFRRRQGVYLLDDRRVLQAVLGRGVASAAAMATLLVGSMIRASTS